MAVIYADATEIFPIQDSLLYDCRVFHFYASHSELDIQFLNHNDKKSLPRYITFRMVEYFSGPIFWRGIDFNIEPNQRTLQFVQRYVGRRFGHFNQEVAETFRLRLYIIKRPEVEIKIVAHEIIGVWEQADLENR